MTSLSWIQAPIRTSDGVLEMHLSLSLDGFMLDQALVSICSVMCLRCFKGTLLHRQDVGNLTNLTLSMLVPAGQNQMPECL